MANNKSKLQIVRKIVIINMNLFNTLFSYSLTLLQSFAPKTPMLRQCPAKVAHWRTLAHTLAFWRRGELCKSS